MDDAEFDAMVARAEHPRLIPQIYSYCDRWCDRCPFTERCLNFLEAQRQELDPPADPLLAAKQTLGRAFEMMRIIARREGIDLSVTPEELAEATREQEAHDRAVAADPLVVQAEEYACTASGIVAALSAVVEDHGDDRVIDAVDRIGWLTGLICAKTYRAVSARLHLGDTAVQSDANGSAKVARLFVAESRACWRVLMEQGRATANGVPAKLVKRLTDLDAALAERFPDAMAFRRPGFDDQSN